MSWVAALGTLEKGPLGCGLSKIWGPLFWKKKKRLRQRSQPFRASKNIVGLPKIWGPFFWKKKGACGNVVSRSSLPKNVINFDIWCSVPSANQNYFPICSRFAGPSQIIWMYFFIVLGSMFSDGRYLFATYTVPRALLRFNCQIACMDNRRQANERTEDVQRRHCTSTDLEEGL